MDVPIDHMMPLLPTVGEAPPKAAEYDLDHHVWYFAYGSNLSSQTFSRDRHLTPLDSVAARIIGWKLTFEIPGVPYRAPVFASIRPKAFVEPAARFSEKDLIEEPPDVVGTAYLLTRSQYMKLVASEAGGAAYDELETWATPVSDESPRAPIRVRTLCTVKCFKRDRSYPSQRYMNIIAAGAKESHLPPEYRSYLSGIPVYIPPTEGRGKLGAKLFLAFWVPVLSATHKLVDATVNGETGQAPWAVKLTVRIAFLAMWWWHDHIYSKFWGRGDR